MIALLVGRFHAVTAGQARWIQSLGGEPGIDHVVCAITSADHAWTRRNPLEASLRERIVRPVLESSGMPFEVVRVDDVPDDEAWPQHVASLVSRAIGREVSPAGAVVYTANRAVDELFARAGFRVISREVQGLTPHELVQRVAGGQPWREEAAPSTIEVYEQEGIPQRLGRIFSERLLDEDGELAAHRDFATYGSQMDASLAQKLEDLAPWIVPGRIVDKGCGTGKLLVELSRRFPSSSFVGVDMSRELLRQSDGNHYACDDVTLVFGNVVGRQLEPGTATTVIFSSVMHEVYSYSGYDLAQVRRALVAAADELGPGGRVLVREGVSPPEATWRMRLRVPEPLGRFGRFAVEFRHGAGAPHERLSADTVRISSHLANEFLCKKDYVRNWAIEVNEEYGILTEEGWRSALVDVGLEPVMIRDVLNSWIVKNRYEGTVELTDEEGRTLPWPPTNVVVVGEKRSESRVS